MTPPDGRNDYFPDRNIPDEKKDEAYILQMGQAFYRRWCGYPMCGYGPGNTALPETWNLFAAPWEMQKYRNFARALNNGEAQKKAHQLNDADANGAQTAMKIHWTPSMYQLKPMNAIGRMMSGRKTELVATAIDQDSVDAADQRRWEEIARIDNANDPKVRELDAAMGVDNSLPKDQPQTREEHQAWTSMGVKDAQATALTQGVALIKLKGDYDNKVRKKLAEELRDTGIGIVLTKVNGAGLPVSEVIEVENAVLPYTRNNFIDMREVGVIDWMAPEEIEEEVGDRFSKEDYDQIYEMVRFGCTDGRTYPAFDGGPMRVRNMPGKVPVLRFYFRDVNHIKMSERKGRTGKTLYKEGEAGGKWKTKRTAFEVIYEGCWIIGTYDGDGQSNKKMRSLSWGCGLMNNRGIFEGDLYKARLPVTVRAYNMTEMRNMSIAHLAMIKCIEIDELVIQLRTVIRKTIPPGLKYNTQAILRTMSDLNLPAEKKIAHVLEMFNQTGSVGYAPIDFEQPEGYIRDPSIPIEPHAGFIGEMERLANQIDWHKNDLNETLGLNDALLGNPTGERQSVGGLKIQAQSGQNAMGFLFDTFDEIEEQVALMEYNMFQCVVRTGVSIAGYVKLLGEPAGKVIRFAADNMPASVGIKAVMHMTEDQEAWMREVVQQSIGAGQIDAVDGAMVMKEHNFNLALQKLRLRIDFKAKQKQENQMQLVQAQGQSVQQSTKMTVDGKAMETQAKVEAQMAVAQQKGETELALFDRNAQAEERKELLIGQRETAKQNAIIMAALNELMIKVESQERIAREDRASAEKIAEDANEAAEEIAEKQAEAAKSRPKPKG